MAGYASRTDWHRTSDHPLAVGLRSRLAPAGLALFFKFARNDEFISEQQAMAYVGAAPEPFRHVRWYDTDHLFTNCDEASCDRIGWLNERLSKEGTDCCPAARGSMP